MEIIRKEKEEMYVGFADVLLTAQDSVYFITHFSKNSFILVNLESGWKWSEPIHITPKEYNLLDCGKMPLSTVEKLTGLNELTLVKATVTIGE